MPPLAILWLRRDLRLSDQPALAAAIASGAAVIPLYILDDDTPRHRAMGGASRWWLHHSLTSLGHDLAARGARLILRRGESAVVLASLAAETGATTIHALHHHEPWWRNAERAVVKAGLNLTLHHGNYLAPPASVLSGAGTPFRIFTPFWRALQAQMPPAPPLPRPAHIPAPPSWPASDTLPDWRLTPTTPDWSGGLATAWVPGEAGAQARLPSFAKHAAAYADTRNLPSKAGTSGLSPHLAFGEISPATVWHGVCATMPTSNPGVASFLSELGWRDYAANIIVQFPDYASQSAKPAFAAFPWREGAEAEADRQAWQRGRTGYPIIDAGMRQLWVSGWVHNRVRMLVASFLIKHLLIDWRHGERWFWDTLVDADYAQNAVNWQWSAGSGVDANVFTRMMAPLTQSTKFAAGDYIRRWVPELAGLDDTEIHEPTPMARARLGYPPPLIDHVAARNRALAAYHGLKPT